MHFGTVVRRLLGEMPPLVVFSRIVDEIISMKQYNCIRKSKTV